MITGGPSNFEPARVPYGMDLAAAWSWRFLVICGAGAIILWLLNLFLVVVLPVVIALLIAALVSPVVVWAQRIGIPRKLASLLVVILGIGLIALLVTFVGNQVGQGVGDLSKQVTSGIDQVREWLRDGPLHVTDAQLSEALDKAQETIASYSEDAVGRVGEVGTAVGHVVAGMFIVLFSTYFFLADGHLIWSWVVRLFPRAGRMKADSSGRVAWKSLTQFVRATVLVAGTDAIGIMIGAAVLGVPFVGAIGVLVFLGAFVPMIGAFVSGTVAVLVALVAVGSVQGADDVRRRGPRAAARGARAPALPDGPLRLGAPARRDHRDRPRRDRGRHPGRPDRRTPGRVAERRRPAPRELHRGRRGRRRRCGGRICPDTGRRLG